MLNVIQRHIDFIPLTLFRTPLTPGTVLLPPLKHAFCSLRFSCYSICGYMEFNSIILLVRTQICVRQHLALWFTLTQTQPPLDGTTRLRNIQRPARLYPHYSGNRVCVCVIVRHSACHFSLCGKRGFDHLATVGFPFPTSFCLVCLTAVTHLCLVSLPPLCLSVRSGETCIDLHSLLISHCYMGRKTEAGF